MNIDFFGKKRAEALEKEIAGIKDRERRTQAKLKAFEGMTAAQFSAAIGKQEGYMELNPDTVMSYVAMAFTCIDRISEKLSTLPIQHVKVDPKTGEGSIVETRYSMLLKNPNPHQTIHEFFKAMLIDYYIYGASYIFAAPFMPNVEALWVLPAGNVSRLSPAETWKPVDTYQFTLKIFPGDTKFIKVDPDDKTNRLRNVMSFVNISDTGQWVPASVLKPIMKQMLVLYQMQEYQSNMFANTPAINGIVYLKEMLQYSDGDLEKLTAIIQRSIETAKNAGKTVILPDISQIQQWAVDWKTLGIEETAKLTRADILAYFKIPPEVYGGDVSTKSTYNNVETAWKFFYTETLMPFLNRWLSMLNNFFYPAGDYRFEINIKGLPFWADYCKTIDSISCLKINEKRNLIGYPPVPNGESIVINNTTLEEIAAGQQKFEL